MTKIASVKTHPISLPRPSETWTAHEPMKAWSVILVEVTTDDGLVGHGEIHNSPMPRICEWAARLGEVIRGMDALAHAAVWEKLFALTSPGPGRIAGQGGLPPPVPRGERTPFMAALGGIDLALWDLKGKAAGMPVYRLLGGENRPIFTYATGGYYRPGASDRDYGAEMARFVEQGYRAVKLKTGAGTPAEEAARIAAVRRAIGDDPLLMLDMNAAYDLADCIDFAHRVEPHRIFWLEEPLHWYLHPADFAKLAAATPIPLAHGERELTRFTVRDFITQGAIRYVQFDATRAGGFTEAWRVAQFAEQLGVIVAPHTAPEIHSHLVLAQPRGAFGVGRARARPVRLRPFSRPPPIARRPSRNRRPAGLWPRSRLGLCRKAPRRLRSTPECPLDRITYSSRSGRGAKGTQQLRRSPKPLRRARLYLGRDPGAGCLGRGLQLPIALHVEPEFG